MKPLKTGYLLPTAFALAAASTASHAGITDTVTQMVTEGSANLAFRYRYETVDQDNARKDADASTLRTQLTLQTATISNFTALFEAEDVSTIGPDDYDSLIVDDKHFGRYSVVADPTGTEINQFWLKYGFTSEGNGTLGRQRINYANQRFLGGVAWRQHEQTFDAMSFNYDRNGYSVKYSYIWQVNRVFKGKGESVQPEEFKGDSHALLAGMPLLGGTLSGYLYALDIDEQPPLSSITYGASYDATFDPVTIAASIATQSDYKNNPTSYDAMYLSLEGKLNLKPVALIGGYELLGSDDGNASFKTPLATLHKFQGWADIFLVTPNDGVEDLYAGITGNIGPVALAAFYHDFSADHGGDDYGTEVDLSASYPLNKYFKFELKYADYDADDYAVDTKKFWFSVMANF